MFNLLVESLSFFHFDELIRCRAQKLPPGLGVFHSDTLDEHRNRTDTIIPTASAVLAEAVGMRRIRSFSNFNKSRDAACCVKITTHHQFLFLRLYLYQHVMVRLPSAPPVTQTIPLSIESKESLVYIHVCVFEIFGKSRALVSRWAVKPILL